MALEQLGLTKAEVSEVLSELDFSKNQTPEEIVQEALKIYRSRRKL
jgi:Holliday junction resolvasome RuvABC DNA-binding subunit